MQHQVIVYKFSRLSSSHIIIYKTKCAVRIASLLNISRRVLIIQTWKSFSSNPPVLISTAILLFSLITKREHISSWERNIKTHGESIKINYIYTHTSPSPSQISKAEKFIVRKDKACAPGKLRRGVLARSEAECSVQHDLDFSAPALKSPTWSSGIHPGGIYFRQRAA